MTGVLGRSALAAVSLALCLGCTQPDPNRVQGYVEGEFVYVASPYAGELETLPVDRGTRVEPGTPLFSLDPEPQKAARDEAARRVAQARSNLEDLKKGRRPTEIAALEAQLKQMRAGLIRSESELARVDKLFKMGSGSEEDIVRARATRDQDIGKVAQLEADLNTARLPAREDQIAAAEANLHALQSALAKAEWDLAEKKQAAPKPGLVFDVLYRPGEWVAAGKPVVVLLPPANVKVRAFVPEQRVGAIHPGDRVRVVIDGVAEPKTGMVSFISPRAEFTPPVIYSRESRRKLVFMVELVFDDAVAAQLNPGQPVDVYLQPQP
jgi:HlyD family secretion protein